MKTRMIEWLVTYNMLEKMVMISFISEYSFNKSYEELTSHRLYAHKTNDKYVLGFKDFPDLQKYLLFLIILASKMACVIKARDRTA